MRINKSLIAYTPTSGAGSGSVTSVALTAPTGFTVSGSPITTSGTLALSFTTGYGIPPLMTGNSGRFLTTNGTTMSWVNIAGTDVTGAALTEVDDTNVTMTLGGTPSTALLRSVSMTLGWAGQLSAGRGGTGTSGVTGIMLGNATAPVTGITGIGGQLLRINPSTLAYEFYTAPFLQSPMTTLGDIIYGGASGAPLRLGANTTGNNMYLRSVSAGAPAWASIAGSDITGAALTEIDDTNVTMTLGGTPANSLLRSVSMTLGWTGQLAVPRGGTGASSLTGVVIGNSTGAMTAVAGTSEQLLRRNTANTAYEFFTPTYLGNPMTSLGDIIYGNAAGAPLRLGANATATNKYLRSVNGGAPSWEEINAVSGSGTSNYVSKWTSSTGLGNSQIQDNGTNVGIGFAGSWKLDVNGVIGLSGTAFAEKSGNYNVIYDGSGAASIYVGGTTANLNAYSNTLHSYQNKGGTVEFATISGDGLNVKIGRIQLPSTNYLTWGGAYGANIPTIQGTSGTGAFLSFFPSGSSSGEKMRISDSGQLRLNGYTSPSSFSGIVQGYLAFTSGGLIVTTATPGGVSGTQNYLAKFDSTGIAVGNSRIVDDGTNFLLNGATSVVTGLNLVGNFSATDSQGGSILLRRSAVPTSGQTLGLLDAYGITTGSTYQMGGGIEFRASQNWNSTSAGTELAIQTTPDNTIAPADMFVFLNNGAVRFIGRTSNPIGAAAGTMYYNSSANNMRYYNGTSWITF